MPEKTLNEVFSEIADAIREKSESSETIKPINMATAIEEIPTGPQFHNTLVSFSDGDEYWSLEPYNPSFLVSKAAAEYSGNSSDVEVVGGYEGAGLYYYSTNTSPGTLTRLYSGYYDSEGNELDGLTGEGYYHFDGIDSFVDLGLNAGSGYYMQGDMPYPISLPINWEYAGGSIVTLNLPYEVGQTYTYVNRDEGQTPFVSYTPGPTPEKGKYYYGNALTAQTLENETLYWKGDGDNISLDLVQLTAGSTYTWNGHSFIPYSSQEEIDAAINELTGKTY